MGNIAKFIASISPDIAYSLLAFSPQFFMHDIPPTSGDLAKGCLKAAREEGLRNVRTENVHLLSQE